MPLKPLADYELLAAQAHGHLCAGQILGLRMALHGMKLLGLDDPTGKDRKRLVRVPGDRRRASTRTPASLSSNATPYQPAAAASWSCSSRHITLPDPDFGSASTNCTIFGTL